MSTYDKRLQNIALAFSDPEAVDSILSTDEEVEKYSTQNMYDKVNEVEDALTFDENGLPYDPTLPRYDRETGVQIDGEGMPLPIDVNRALTNDEELSFAVNQTSFFDELLDSPGMVLTGMGHGFYNEIASFFGDVKEPTDAGADSITDQVSYQVGVGASQFLTTAGLTAAGGAIGGATAGPGGAATGAKIGMGLSLALNTISNRAVEKQSMLSEGLAKGLTSDKAEKFATETANEITGLDLLQEGLPLTVYGKGLLRSVEARQALKAAKRVEKTADTAKDAFKLATTMRGGAREFSKEMMTKLKPYLDSGLLKFENGIIKVADKKALTKLIAKDTLRNTFIDSGGESVIEVIETIAENVNLNEALGYEEKDPWEGTGEAAIVAGLASGISSGTAGIITSGLPIRKYNATMKGYERIQQKLKTLDEQAQVKTTAQGDIVINEPASQFTGDENAKGTIQTNISDPLQSPVIVDNEQQVINEQTVDEVAQDVNPNNIKENKVETRKLKPIEKVEQEQLNNTEETRKVLIEQQTNDPKQVVDFKKKNKGSGDEVTYQQAPTVDDDTSVDNRIESKDDSVGETVQETLAALKLNEQENLNLLQQQAEQMHNKGQANFEKQDLHYSVKEEIRNNDNLVSIDACKVAAQNLMSKLGIKLTSELDTRGSEGQKVTDENVVGVHNAKARTITIRNSTDIGTIFHELSHHVYDSVLEKIKNKDSFATDVRNMYNDVKKILGRELDTMGLNKAQTTEEMFGEIINAYSTKPAQINEIVEKYGDIFNAFEDSINEYEGGLSSYYQLKQVVFNFYNQPADNQSQANLSFANRAGEASKPFWAKVKSFPRMMVMYPEYRADVMRAARDCFGQFLDNTYMLNKEIDHLMKLDSSNQYIKTFENITSKIRFLQGGEMDVLTAFIAGNGMTFSSRSEIHGYKNLLEIRDDLYKFAEGNDFKGDTRKMERDFGVFMVALATIGENLGSDKYVAWVESVSGKDPNAFLNAARDFMMLNTKSDTDVSIDLWKHFVDENKTEFSVNDPELTHIFKHIRKTNTLFKKTTDQQFVNIMNNYRKNLMGMKQVQAYATNNKISYLKAVDELFRKRIDTSDTGLNLIQAMGKYNEIVNSDKYETYMSAAQGIYNIEKHVANYLKQASVTTKYLTESFEKMGGAFHIPLIRSFIEGEEKAYSKEVNDESYVGTIREGSDRPTKDLFDSLALQIRQEICKAHMYSSLESIASLAGYGKDSNRLLNSIIAANEAAGKEGKVSRDELALAGYGNILQRVVPDEEAIEVSPYQKLANQTSKLINEIENNTYKSEEQRNQEIKLVRKIESNVKKLLNNQLADINKVEIPKEYTDIIAYQDDNFAMAVSFAEHVYNGVNTQFKNLLQNGKNDVKHFTIYDKDGNVMKFQVMDKNFLAGIVNFSLSDLLLADGGWATTLKTITKINNQLMYLSKMFYTTLSLPFVLFTNPIRDMTELMIKNPLYKDSNFITFSQVKEVFTEYMSTWFNDYLVPHIIGISKGDAVHTRLQLLDKFGLGYNTRFRTVYDLNEFKQIDGELVPRSKWGQIFKFLEASDKIGRFTQLKLLMKHDGIDIDAFEVTKANIAGLDGFSKNTLRKNGVTDEMVLEVLTPEQAKIWHNTKDTDFLQYLDLSEEQYQKLYNQIDHTKLQQMSPDMVAKYAKILRECTTDFARGSASTRAINKYFMFFGARLNGLVEYGRWAKVNPQRAMGVALEAVMMGALMQLSGLLLEDDDEMMQSAIRFKIGDTIFKLPVSNEPAMAFNFGRVAAKLSPGAMGDFIGTIMKDNTVGLFDSPRGAFPAGLAVVQGLTGSNVTKFTDPFSGYSVHSAGDWYRFRNVPSKLLGPNTSTLALAFNRIIPSVSPSMWDYVLNDVIGFGSVASVGVDAALNTLSYFGPDHDLFNYVRVQLNPNVTPTYTKKDLGDYLLPMFQSADKYVYTKEDRELKKLFSIYVSDYYKSDVSLDGKPKTPEQHNLYNKYNMSYEATQMVNMWYKIINMTQDDKERLSYIKQKNEMVKQYLDELNNGTEFTKERKSEIHREVTAMRNKYKADELAKKQKLLGIEPEEKTDNQ